ncbi:hypothetical protein Vretifemale_20316 [Volvox reticuliferus]|uniref:Uncharacterized protein n=2 Tax=Volvox reticuliferus TaxID=1737510 RepID=A0A8J4FW70_9CHLO|nr:hypothetical protein Vretifemale_20316 [Volvox reticuliferus]
MTCIYFFAAIRFFYITVNISITLTGKPTTPAPAPAPAPASAAGEAEGPAANAAGGCSGGGDCELVIRTALDAWLILRAAPGGRRLYAASEQSTLADLALTQGLETQTLTAAVASTDALCDRLFPGIFLNP